MTISDILYDIFYGDEAEPWPPTVYSTYLGDTALHIAARLGNFIYVKTLLYNGAEVNATGDMGFTALHEAVAKNHFEIAELLLNSGASYEIINEFDDTALDLAKCDKMRSILLKSDYLIHGDT